MVKRCNHYEGAFEAYLRARRIPYLAVNEARRSLWGDVSLKNLDFVVSPASDSTRWLVDVKGRHFPAGERKQYWRNWTTADELSSLGRWESLLGASFNGLLVFAYLVRGELAPLPAERLFTFRGAQYGFLGIRLDHYLSCARVISPKWETVAVSAERFRALARPVDELFSTVQLPATAATAS